MKISNSNNKPVLKALPKKAVTRNDTGDGLFHIQGEE
jgi:hypothetical protein